VVAVMHGDRLSYVALCISVRRADAFRSSSA
jgi:hypothetical protein